MLYVIEERIIDMMDWDFKEEGTMRKAVSAVKGRKRKNGNVVDDSRDVEVQ